MRLSSSVKFLPVVQGILWVLGLGLDQLPPNFRVLLLGRGEGIYPSIVANYDVMSYAHLFPSEGK